MKKKALIIAMLLASTAFAEDIKYQFKDECRNGLKYQARYECIHFWIDTKDATVHCARWELESLKPIYTPAKNPSDQPQPKECWW